jgi:hypothetical protein
MPNPFAKHARLKRRTLALISILSWGILTLSPALAVQNVTPWTNEKSFQNLTYGMSSYTDVENAVGHPPDEVLNSGQMYPVVTNYVYYDEKKTGAASIFVFENGFLVGLQYRSPDNQFIDFTYCLQNNGDRALNYPYMAGYMGYYPYFPLYGFSGY